MRFSRFAAFALSAASAVSAIPVENIANLNDRQLGSGSCDIASCAEGLIAALPGLLSTSTSATLPLILQCATDLITSQDTAVPVCLLTFILITETTVRALTPFISVEPEKLTSLLSLLAAYQAACLSSSCLILNNVPAT
ncbi:hypothetical protein BDQ17DRAFT_1430089 [Cyathus striatus]|nr:hypothetical protein BDQ17DRAFT_1430089 [Cyathus striatus]